MIDLNLSETELKPLVGRIVTILAELYDGPIGRPTGFRNGNGSGFVVEVDGEHWLVTAGHVVDGLKEVAAAGVLAKLMLCDAWAEPEGNGRTYPIPFDSGRWSTWGEADGLDLGLFELGPVVAAGLAAGRIVAFAEREWSSSPAPEFHILLGTPGEAIAATRPPGSSAVAFDLKRAVIGVEPIARPEGIAPPTARPRFYGRLTSVGPGPTLGTVEGMSGGPVLGCRRTAAGIEYTPVAVQSSWYPQSKIIVADFLPQLTAEVRRRISAR